MNINPNSRLHEESNDRKKYKFINSLEKECDGLESILCNNVMDTISKKIDAIEQDFSKRIENKENVQINENSGDEKVSRLNKNISVIERSFSNHLNSPDSNFSEIIRKKIEENYMLLDELEKSSIPIFAKFNGIDNKNTVENKIKAMDDKLTTLFSSDNAKMYSARNLYFNSNIIENEPDVIEEKTNNNQTSKQYERDKKIKELYDKLVITEKKIKKIAGNLLENF